MNVFIVAVCVNLLTLVNAVQNVNFETLLEILKSKPISSVYSNNIEISDPDEVLPILPGFYLEKPKDLSRSLFKNPKAWPDDIYYILDEEEVERNKTKVNENTEISTSEDEYLQGKMLKAVEDLKRFRASQKHQSDNKFKERQIDSENAQKEPVKKLLGRLFQGMHSGIDYKRKQRNRKPKKITYSKNNEVLGELLRKILSRNLNNQPFQNTVQNAYAKPEEERQSREELLGNILNDIQYNPLERESETYLSPSIVVISPTSRDNDDNEMDNNAMEETSNEDSTGLLTTKTRRTINDPDIGDSKKDSSTESEVESSDYEKNPGNPYTVHKNKYKQNWPYNHFMDGDHMNINPFGPNFGSLGPTGPELFFGRKWWYYNQDDFKPMG